MSEWKVITGDALKVLPTLVDAAVIVSDPPYPVLDYGWACPDLAALQLPPKQLWFWMRPPVVFPLPITAMHVWSKSNVYIGTCEQWEAIYEVGGGKVASVWRAAAINCEMNAQMNGDTFYEHPCQKPLKLMRRIVEHASKPGDIVIDPFCGSGTTGVACVQTGRNFIGIEIDPKYADIARRRIADAVPLFAQTKPCEEQMEFAK